MGLCNYRDNAGPPLHTGLSQEAPPSGGRPGLGTGAGQGELGSPQMAWLFLKEKLLAFYELGRCLQCSAGMNSGASSILRTSKSRQLGLSSCLF